MFGRMQGIFSRNSNAAKGIDAVDEPEVEESSGSGSTAEGAKGPKQHMDSSSDVSTSHTGNRSVEDMTKDRMTAQETKYVKRSKVLVYVALLVAAGAVGAATYVFTSRSETANFHEAVR